MKQLLVLPLLFAVVTGAAQSKQSKFEIGGGVSAFVYQGDLTPSRMGSLRTIKPGILLFVNYKLKTKWALQGAFNWGSLKGDEAKYDKPDYRIQRAFAFTTPVVELSAKAVYHVLGTDADETRKVAPYVAGGLGVSFLNIKRDYSRLNAAYFENIPTPLSRLQEDINQAPPKVLLTVPVTIGARKYISRKFSAFAEGTYRFMFSDYLDGFSKSVSEKYNDHFYTVSLGVIYKFKKDRGIDCPRF
jgi:hypothetical protein